MYIYMSVYIHTYILYNYTVYTSYIYTVCVCVCADIDIYLYRKRARVCEKVYNKQQYFIFFYTSDHW